MGKKPVRKSSIITVMPNMDHNAVNQCVEMPFMGTVSPPEGLWNERIIIAANGS